MSRNSSVYQRICEDEDASAFIRRSFSGPSLEPLGPIADIASGAGRHAFYLARRGYRVVCLDSDINALSRIERFSGQMQGHLLPVLIDFSKVPLPFGASTLGGSLCCFSWKYDWCADVLGQATLATMVGGFIVLETVSNRGRNYLELPPAGYLYDLLIPNFTLMVYEERTAGPNGIDAVTVRAVGKRR